MLRVEAEGGASQVVDTQEHGREGQGMTFGKDREAHTLQTTTSRFFSPLKDTYSCFRPHSPKGKTELNSAGL